MELPRFLQIEPVGQCNLRCRMSLDAASPAGYEAIRVCARQVRALRNLDRLLQARRDAVATLPRVRLVAVAMRANLHELPDNEARDAAARLGVTLRLPAPRPRIVATPDRINFGDMVREGAEQVWNNDAYRQFRERLAGGPPPEVCRSCAVYNGTC